MWKDAGVYLQSTITCFPMLATFLVRWKKMVQNIFWGESFHRLRYFLYIDNMKEFYTLKWIIKYFQHLIIWNNMNKISMLINKLIIFSGVYFISHSDFWNGLCPTDHSISLLRYCLLSDVILKYNTEFYFYSFALTKKP